MMRSFLAKRFVQNTQISLITRCFKMARIAQSGDNQNQPNEAEVMNIEVPNNRFNAC